MHTHHRTHVIRYGVVTLLVGVALYASVPVLNAAVIRTGSTYTLESDAGIEGDAYLVGEDVTTRGSATGDVLVAAGSGTITGPIGGDALLLGGTLTVTAPVAGDVRAVGGELSLSGSTTEDAILAGGTVILTDTSSVGGDLLVYADYLELNGIVAGHVEAHARSVIVRGTLTGPAEFDANESLTFTGDAQVMSETRYRAPREAVVADTVQVAGTLIYEPVPDGAEDAPDADWTGFLVRALIAIVAGVLLLVLFPRFTNAASVRALTNNGTLALIGFAVLVCTPLLTLIMLVSFVGIVPGIVILLLYLLALTVAFAFSPVLAGTMLARWLSKTDLPTVAWVSFGAFALSFITLLPFVGWLVRFLVFLVALGTVCIFAYEGLWKKRRDADTLAPGTAAGDNTTPPPSDHEADTHAAPDTPDKQ